MKAKKKKGPRKCYITIMGKEFEFKMVAPSKMPGLAGLCEVLEAIIYVTKGQSALEKKRTIIHEITHGALHRMGFDQTLSHDQMEQICVMNENLFTETFSARLNKHYKE